MKLDLSKLATDMFNAAFPILKKDAPEIANFARGEFQKLAVQIATIEAELEAKEITDEQARILIDMQKSAARVVLLTAKGLSLLTVERALNAALDVARTALNTALGVAIL